MFDFSFFFFIKTRQITFVHIKHEKVQKQWWAVITLSKHTICHIVNK